MQKGLRINRSGFCMQSTKRCIYPETQRCIEVQYPWVETMCMRIWEIAHPWTEIMSEHLLLQSAKQVKFSLAQVVLVAVDPAACSCAGEPHTGLPA